jgi:hypothetical protein
MKKFFSISAFALAAALLALPAMAAKAPSANLPPDDDYVSPADVHLAIKNGDVTLALGDARHARFFNISTTKGGILGGEIERFDSTLQIHFTGTGPLAGWSRTVSVPAKSETHIAPRDPKAPFQSFETVMYRIEGAIQGDPDFESLSIVAGTGNGLDSPGHTTFIQQKDGSFVYDSKFNIKYVASFTGAKGGKLDGVSDTFEGVITMQAVDAGAQTAK